MNEPKPFEISKWVVWEAYRRVKANQGAAGVDEVSMAEFEVDLIRKSPARGQAAAPGGAERSRV